MAKNTLNIKTSLSDEKLHNTNRVKIFSYGFLSGYIYCFLTITLQAVLTDLGYSITFISSLAFVLLPYSFKFLWSGFADDIKAKNIHNWLSLFVMIIGFNFLILVLAINSNKEFFYIMLFNLAFLGASFDILTDINLIKNYNSDNRHHPLSLHIFGWRISSIFAGGGIIFLFNLIFKGDLNYLFIFSSFIFLACTLIFSISSFKLMLQFFKKQKYHLLLLIPIISIFFIATTSLYNFKESKSVFNSLKEIYIYLIFYKLFDLTLSSFVIIFLIKEFKLTLEYFGTINIILPLLAVLLCGYLWPHITKIFSLKSIMITSLILKTTNIFLFILINSLDYKSKSALIILFSLNIISSSFITYTFSNFLMRSIDEPRASFKYSIASSLSTASLLITVPIASFLINNYSWNIFFLYIIILQLFSYISIKNIKNSNQ
ncbi:MULTISPECIES: hypothetical protein [unclassified Acinetobacter]|uniref:hypothetical protein n=1 Tax=unclassified Acinetobacter TaxID=196816 RepID=UPI0029353335|nr:MULTISPECIES: hypothetical protein [unclassified Acinetobacter]WOE33276.1 hypothetical protein QSG84_16085 [Acinetobacter sp. SAAs470]WOE36943.1 hypothetical protein QSG86_00800 [Acinetobacter sp. SAAs474]